MSVIGLDFGSQSCVVAVVNKGGIDIITNDVSNRRTPTVVGFSDRMREIGEAGKTQQARNIRNTISGVKRLLGRKFSDPLLKKELARCGACNWVEMEDGSLGVEVSLRGTKHTLSMPQVAAMLFSKLSEITQAYTQITRASDYVISVPTYFTEAQRRAVLDAAKIAGIHTFQVVNDISAIALSYGFYKHDLKDPIKVMFIDFGATALEVGIAEFTANKCEILATAFDSNLGGFDIDDLLAEHFANNFQQKTGLNIKENKRAWQRVLDAVEKTKKSLNENESAGINIECLMEDNDLNDRITKQDYLALLKNNGFFERVMEPIKAVLKETGLEAKQLDSIEMVGSSMRVVAIQEAITQFLGRNLSATLNAEESIAKGCALQCALLSPLFKVREYKLVDKLSYPITLNWSSVNDPNDTKVSSVSLFNRGEALGKFKNITFTRADAKPFEIITKYTDPTSIQHKDQAEGVLAVGKIVNIPKPSDPTVKDAEVRVKIRLDNNGLVSYALAELEEKKEVVEEVPVEEPKDQKKEDKKDEKPATPESEQPKTDAQNDTEMKDSTPTPEKPKTVQKKMVKKFYTKIDIQCKYPELTPEQIKNYVTVDNEMRKVDEEIVATANAKNHVESLIYKYKDYVNGIWSEFTLDNERETINKICQETEDWLYGDGEDVKKEIYDAKYNEIKALGDPISKRYNEWSAVPPALKDLQNTIANFRNEVNSGNEKYSHLTKEDFDKILNECTQHETWLNQSLDKQQTLKKTEKPAFSSSDLLQRKQNLASICTPILNKPKPAPPKEEKKEEKKPETTQEQPKQEQKQENTQEEKMDTDPQ